MNVVMFIGAPGSGKTSFRKQIINVAMSRGLHVETICKDDIREELLGSRSDNSCNKEIYFEANRRMVQHIKERTCDILILDSCHHRRNTRLDIMRAIRPNLEPGDVVTAVYFKCPEDILLHRNEVRDESDRIPTSVVCGIYHSMQSVSFGEGFDNCICLSYGTSIHDVDDVLRTYPNNITMKEQRHVKLAASGG